MKYLWVLLGIWPIWVAGNANAKQAELVIYTEQFPPYNFLQDERIQGINVDLVKEACKASGIECQFELLPWTRAINKAMAEPNAGLVSTSRIAEREGLFQWVGPLVSSPACFYRLKQRTDIRIYDDTSLLQYSIGLPRGDIYQTVLQALGFEEGKNFLLYSNKYDDIKMFALGKLDLAIASAFTLPSVLAAGGLTLEDVQAVYEVKDDALRGNYLALNKAIPLAVTTLLQQKVEEILNSKLVNKTVSHYLPEITTYAQKQLPESAVANSATNKAARLHCLR